MEALPELVVVKICDNLCDVRDKLNFGVTDNRVYEFLKRNSKTKKHVAAVIIQRWWKRTKMCGRDYCCEKYNFKTAKCVLQQLSFMESAITPVYHTPYPRRLTVIPFKTIKRMKGLVPLYTYATYVHRVICTSRVRVVMKDVNSRVMLDHYISKHYLLAMPLESSTFTFFKVKEPYPRYIKYTEIILPYTVRNHYKIGYLGRPCLFKVRSNIIM